MYVTEHIDESGIAIRNFNKLKAVSWLGRV